MSIIGKTLGNFTLEARIGKGGMGEVYKAKDQKLGRDVAIKVLPEEFAKDTDRVARFQREAKLLASLNHPNIAAIHGLEESDGTHFLVLELIEGDTLADRIKSGPIPAEEALKLALQIAEALEAAHEKGVIHRDLKPANIKVTPEGKVKVLDFGLAKAFAGERADLDLSKSPTLSVAATQQGVILGTAAYMSPEQARGESVDKKADIWAFGVILFEMLTGRGTFEGQTVSDILASVIKTEPAWNRLPSNLHPRIRLLLERCLEKDPKNRYGVIGDARVDIQKVLTDPSGVLVQPVTVVEPRNRLRTIFPWIAAALVLGAIIAGVAVWKLRPSEPRQVTRFSYELPMDQQFGNLTSPTLAVSPDGSKLVYSTDAGLYLRSMDGMDAKLLPGTGGSFQQPFFSPDGEWIGFLSSTDNKLKKIATSGGTPVTLADVDDVVFATANWNADGTIVYSSNKGILRISSNGGAPEQLIKQVENAPNTNEPQILPDGKSVLFSSVETLLPKIKVQSLKSGESKELLQGYSAKYLPTGHIVYGSGNSLFAIRFDINALEVIGGPVSVVDGILRNVTVIQYAVSDSGTLVYIPATASDNTQSSQRTLVWVDRKGKEELLAAQPDDYGQPQISPDGTRVAMTVSRDNFSGDIWIWDIVRETMTRLTFNEASHNPLWFPDGQRVAYGSGSLPDASVYWKAADGAGAEEKLGSLPDRYLFPWSWSKDGKTLVTKEAIGPMSSDIGSISMDGNHEWKPLLQEKHYEAQPKISPDGRWMAYSSDESGKDEVYVRPFPDVNTVRWIISTAGGDSPLWSPDGRELFYRNGDEVMAVAVETEPTFKAGKPETVFRGKYTFYAPAEEHPWDISPDGKRFLMMKEIASTGESAAESPRKINIVLNWTEELKQRVPVN